MMDECQLSRIGREVWAVKHACKESLARGPGNVILDGNQRQMTTLDSVCAPPSISHARFVLQIASMGRVMQQKGTRQSSEFRMVSQMPPSSPFLIENLVDEVTKTRWVESPFSQFLKPCGWCLYLCLPNSLQWRCAWLIMLLVDDVQKSALNVVVVLIQFILLPCRCPHRRLTRCSSRYRFPFLLLSFGGASGTSRSKNLWSLIM
jgi:hypothetical protein